MRVLQPSLAVTISLAILLTIGCGGGSKSTQPQTSSAVNLLTTGNLNGEDDDPTLWVDTQGSIHVVWFSDRTGTRNLYSVQSSAIDFTSGAITWTAPIQITNNAVAQFPQPLGDQFPSFFIDFISGTHHVAWHRTDASNQSHILYAHSDGTAAGWATATVVNVTSGANFDRFPYLFKFATNDLRIFFVSHTRALPLNKDGIWVTKSADNGATWSTPTEVTTLNSATEQSSLPFITTLPATGQTGAFAVVFQRFKLNPANDVLDPTNNIFYAESNDGDTWTTPMQVTSDPTNSENDLAPSFFSDFSGTPHMAWGTTAFGDPTGDIVQMKTADRALYPNAVTHLTSTIGVPDHSPRIAAVNLNGTQVFVMAWVRVQPNQHNQVVYTILKSLT